MRDFGSNVLDGTAAIGAREFVGGLYRIRNCALEARYPRFRKAQTDTGLAITNGNSIAITGVTKGSYISQIARCADLYGFIHAGIDSFSMPVKHVNIVFDCRRGATVSHEQRKPLQILAKEFVRTKEGLAESMRRLSFSGGSGTITSRPPPRR